MDPFGDAGMAGCVVGVSGIDGLYPVLVWQNKVNGERGMAGVVQRHDSSPSARDIESHRSSGNYFAHELENYASSKSHFGETFF